MDCKKLDYALFDNRKVIPLTMDDDKQVYFRFMVSK